jgi:hypothetical protein
MLLELGKAADGTLQNGLVMALQLLFANCVPVAPPLDSPGVDKSWSCCARRWRFLAHSPDVDRFGLS